MFFKIWFPLNGFSIKNGKLYVFQNMVSIKWFLNHYMVSIKWFLNHYMVSIIWFLNQKMENYIFFKKMVSQSKNGFHHIYKNIMIYMFFQTYESLVCLNYW